MSPASTSRKLPARMHFKHGRYYYVHQNKWTPLSRDYHDALVEYAKLIRPNSGGMADLIDRFLGDAKDIVRPNTLKTYGSAAEKIKKAMVEFRPDQVKPAHVAQLLDHYRATPAMANVIRNVLKQAFTKAVVWGLCDTNPVQFVPPAKSKKRDRYLSESEFAAIREKATPTLRAIMDIAYLTGQRIGDVLAIRYADIAEDGVQFRQQKTGNRLKVAMTDDLKGAIESAKLLHRSVRGLTLFHTRAGKPFSYWTIRTLWSRATEAAGVEDAHIHDIRAKAATDAKAQGLDSKALLGHASESAHARYLRSKEIPVAEPVRIRRS